MNKGAGSDRTPCAKMALRHHRRTDPDQGPFTNLYIASQMDARGNVYVIMDVVMMINSASGIQDHVFSNDAAGIHDDARDDHCTDADRHIRCDDCRRVACKSEVFALLP